MAAAGYHGAEIADVMFHSIDYAVDPDLYGYGTPRWQHALEVVLQQAVESHLEIDLTLGAHWPMSVPGLDVNGDASAKELIYRSAVVNGGKSFSGPVPAPTAVQYDDRTSDRGVISSTMKSSSPKFVAAVAYRCQQDGCSKKPVAIDLMSAIDLTAQVSSDNLTWQPPDKHTWIILGCWYQGTAQKNDSPHFLGPLPYLSTDPEGRVVDHFGKAGTTAFINYFKSTILTPPILHLMQQTHGSIFEDSLELNHTQVWTSTFPD